MYKFACDDIIFYLCSEQNRFIMRAKLIFIMLFLKGIVSGRIVKKRCFVLLTFIFVFSFSFGQKVINPKGILTNDFHFIVDSMSESFKIDSCNYFYVVPFKGKTAHELYTGMLARIAHMFENPSLVAQNIEDNTIVVKSEKFGITKFVRTVDDPDADIHEKWDVLVSINYRLEFNFKDGRIRVNPPEITNISEMYMSTGSRYNHHGMSYLKTVYKNDSNAIHRIESYFNNIIPTFLFDIPTDNNW